MFSYYNEWEPYPAQWLRNLIAAGLIAPGEVDERSIKDVKAEDLKGFTQCHFFAGIGGWSYALRLAGWPDDRPVWTGSCPCQPYSSQGNMAKQQDERHLWPDWYRLIKQLKPPVIFGEQVNDGVAAGWLDEVMLDMEHISYTCAAADIAACAAGAPHHRERIWFVCRDTPCERLPEEQEPIFRPPTWSNRIRHETNQWERTGYKPPFPLVAHGVPARMARLRAAGNAIVPQVTQAFIEAFMECRP